MSQHVVVQEEKKFVFGWDQPLMSFYLQVHDTTRDEDDQIIVWLGATADTKMYEVENLVHAAHEVGLLIDHETRVQLYGEKDNGASELIFENLPVQLNLGQPEQVVGWAKASRDSETNRISLQIELDEEVSTRLTDIAEVFDLKAIGFAGIKRRPQDGR